jgi:FAD/FMN-containing dehydrogenase
VTAQHQLRSLAGWGRYPVQDCFLQHCDVARQARDSVAEAGEPTLTPRGLGRSYGDSALNAGGVVADVSGMNYFRAFDETSGLLACEAGVSLAQIIEHFLPRGWFLPTTPGTKYVTVGGAIAADIHGKNHHRVGSFGEFVEEFELLTASGQVIPCSRNNNPDIFFATLGGMGLTGIILWARIRLVRVASAYLAVDYRQTTNFSHTLDLFEAGDAAYEHSVAWVDCLATGASLGRGVVMQANHAAVSELPDTVRSRPLDLPQKRRASVPFVPPCTPLTRWTVRAFNGWFYRKHADKRRIVDIDSFFYPLDAIDHWNRLYGPRGFVQYQAFFPQATSRAGLAELLTSVAASGAASFLAVLKSCGKADGGLLSYLEPGHTLALDIPFHPMTTPRLCRQFDEILLRHGGRVYLAKDAMTDAETFAKMYPRLSEFQQLKRRIDPQCRFSSSQARRVGIVTA